jgi:hypothetical protein
MFEQPTLARRVADTVMDAGIVQHDHHGQTVPGGEHTRKASRTTWCKVTGQQASS